MKILAAFLIISLVPPIGAQLVNAGPPGETREHYCSRIEKVKPNLVLSRTTQMSGRIIDGSGAPFENSVVEVRLYCPV